MRTAVRRVPARAAILTGLALATAATLCSPSAEAARRAALPDTTQICSDDPAEVRLLVQVSGLRAPTGNVTVTLYPADPDRFLDKDAKIARVSVPVTGTVMEICVAAPSDGGYVLAAFHDENGDGRLDKSVIGIPREGYGFSNDATPRLKRPKLEDVRFDARAGDNLLRVSLLH